MRYITIFVLTLSLLLTVSCANKRETESSLSKASNSSTANYTEKAAYPNGLPGSEPISISEAIATLKGKLNKPDENYFYECTSIDFINGKAYYIIRGYQDFPDHRATSGWYATDVFTGDVYNTNGLTDLVKIE